MLGSNNPISCFIVLFLVLFLGCQDTIKRDLPFIKAQEQKQDTIEIIKLLLNNEDFSSYYLQEEIDTFLLWLPFEYTTEATNLVGKIPIKYSFWNESFDSIKNGIVIRKLETSDSLAEVIAHIPVNGVFVNIYAKKKNSLWYAEREIIFLK